MDNLIIYTGLIIFSLYFLFKIRKEYLLSDKESNSKKRYQINLIIGIVLFVAGLVNLIIELLARL